MSSEMSSEKSPLAINPHQPKGSRSLFAPVKAKGIYFTGLDRKTIKEAPLHPWVLGKSLQGCHNGVSYKYKAR